MRIQVKTMTGYIYTLDVEDHDTIYNIMLKIEDMGGPEIDKQKIIWKGKQLDPFKTCEFYSVYEDDTLHMVLKPNRERTLNIINRETQQQWQMTVNLDHDFDDVCITLRGKIRVFTNTETQFDMYCKNGIKINKKNSFTLNDILEGIEIVPRG